MDCEVAVVGGGIGGLTVAALLAARGMDVCLIEREARVGGCASSFEKFDYSFEQGYGLYAGWQPNEVHARVFSELPVSPPETMLLEPSCVVRLPDHSEVALTTNLDQFETNLREVFPECAGEAVAFYRKLLSDSGQLRRAFPTTAELHDPTAAHLGSVSTRFQSFIDVQLHAWTQGVSRELAYPEAALTLAAPLVGMFAIRGGAAALADSLAESITRSGGKVRLNTTALRLSYDSTGQARGVDLLTGETLTASRALISNLTIWDTYGKLIGLNRTPAEIRQQLKSLHGWGAYLLYLAMDHDAAERLVANHILNLTEWPTEDRYDPETNHLMFAAAPSWDARAPHGKRAVTAHAFTAVDDWFTFHTDETEVEEKDQQMLEQSWQRLHKAMPELGSSIEVIDTATPRTFYELTRRRLGMVGSANNRSTSAGYLTSLSNVFLISDTTCPSGIASLTRAAFDLANLLTNRR